MTEQDNYVLGIVNKYKRIGIHPNLRLFLDTELYPLLRGWAGQYLQGDIELSGSIAKETAIIFGSDVDIFVPLRTDIALKDIFNYLYETLKPYSPRKQNVSIGIKYKGFNIDVVPGRVQQGYHNYHSLYKSKADSWTQTNIRYHINNVKNSGRTNEIIALKIWKQRHNLDISSTCLELIVIQALKNKSTLDLANNVKITLQYIADRIMYLRIVDPSNTNNILTDDIDIATKRLASITAVKSLKEPYWGGIIW